MMKRWETTPRAAEQETGVDNVGQAFESLQRVELEETNDAAILCRSEQDLMDTALAQEIPLHKRLTNRQQAIESLTLNLGDGREALNSLLVAGPDRVSKMREELALAQGKLVQAQQQPAPGRLAWLRDGFTQGAEELVSMLARNATRPTGV